jgi:hypothetical protein
MLNTIDLPNLVTHVRDLIGEETAALWPTTAIVRHINHELSRLGRDVCEMDQGYFDTESTLTVTSATVALPFNAWKVRNVDAYVGGEWVRIVPLEASYWWVIDPNNTTTNVPMGFRFVGSNIVLEPGYYDATELKVRYTRAIGPLIYGTVASRTSSTVFTAAPNATYQTAFPIYNDLLNGDRLVVLAGTGVGEAFFLSDYTYGSTNSTFTTAAAATATFDTTTLIGTVLPDPLDKFPDLICYGAAIRALTRRRDTELIAALKDSYGVDYAALQQYVARRQTQASRHVGYTPDMEDI